jgi:ribonuclease R
MAPEPTRQRGTVRVHLRGFGFLIADDDPSQSAFIAPPDLNTLLEGDHVEADVTVAHDGRASASAIHLLERPRKRVFGKVVSHRGGLHVQVDREIANRDWPLDTTDGPTPTVGAFVVAKVYGDHLTLDRCVEPSADPAVERVIARHELPTTFPAEALDQAERVGEQPSREVARRDLRNTPTVTVDAATSRDLDDAIAVLPADADGAVRLLVSISDVSAWVTPNSALDREAFRRATSVYLPDRVLPMLPPSLSEQRLSLLPGQDRACVTVELRITPEGEVSAVDVYRSLIRSQTRLTYEEAAAFLDEGALDPAHESIREMLGWCRTAWARLSMARARRGGVQLAREEARVGIDSQTGRATVLAPYAVTTAHELIERFMVAANEAVARWLADRGVPTPFRVHDEPSDVSVRRLVTMAANFGFQSGFGPGLTPLALAALEHQVRNAPAAPAILAVIGKALGRARYTVYPSLHFGLATERYLHFTSPIRRYADLLVHRAVTGYIDGQRPPDPRPATLEARCHAMNERSSRAAKAEMQARRAVSARFMASRIGETFEANVTGVLSQGLRVQVRGSLVVGWLPADALPDGPYELNDDTQELVGPARSYGVGMPVRVRVERADEVQGSLDFTAVD